MLKPRCRIPAWTSVTVHSRQHLAVGDGRLVERRAVRRSGRPRSRSSAVSETAIVTAEDRVRGERHDRAAAAGEVAPRRPDVAGLLRQPAEPVRDLRLVLGRCPPVRLAVGGDRALQVAVADAGRGDFAPGVVGRGRLGQLEDRLPGRDRAGLVVHPVAGLAGAEQRRRGHLRIVEAETRRSAWNAAANSPRGEQVRTAVEEEPAPRRG